MVHKILGIDPSSVSTGYAILDIQNKPTITNYGCLNLKGDMRKRCYTFYHFFSDLIEKHQIQDVAIETPFVGRNITTYGKLSYFRGLIYLITHNLNLYEYPPATIKKIITGKGNSQKEDVAQQVFILHPYLPTTLNNDITDAIAIAHSTFTCSVKNTSSS